MSAETPRIANNATAIALGAAAAGAVAAVVLSALVRTHDYAEAPRNLTVGGSAAALVFAGLTLVALGGWRWRRQAMHSALVPLLVIAALIYPFATGAGLVAVVRHRERLADVDAFGLFRSGRWPMR